MAEKAQLGAENPIDSSLLADYGRSSWYIRWGKRCSDLLLGCVLLLLLSPIFIVSALAVAILMGPPIIFRQTRPGRAGAEFQILKLRTMDALADGSGETKPDSARITPLGRFLRRNSLDELPGIINVLRGDMSLVGPRPLLQRYTPFLSSREKERFLVQPGITGLAQVNGRNDLPWDERMSLDVEYVRSLSFWLDIKILLRTLPVVLGRKGLRVDPGASMLNLDEERKELAADNGELESCSEQSVRTSGSQLSEPEDA